MKGVNAGSISMSRKTSDIDHLRLVPGAVQVNVTISIGHGLSSLTRKVAEELKMYWQQDVPIASQLAIAYHLSEDLRLMPTSKRAQPQVSIHS